LMTGEEADRASRNAALTLALALPGDTVLYLLLPLHAAAFGISLPEAGFLLAANRIVRIFGYRWVAHFYAAHGPRAACLLATGAAALSTFGYAALSGVWTLLVARLLWGLAFAAMNIAVQALPTAELQNAPRRMGRARAIVAVGPTSALVVAGLTSEWIGPRPVFLSLGIVALVAPIFAVRLPRVSEPVRRTRLRLTWPDAFSVWSFCMGFTLDGLFVFGLALMATSEFGQAGVLAASLAMALRYASEILLSSSGGALGHRFGARRMLVGLSIGAAASLVLLASPKPALWFGILATVILRGLMQPLPAPVIAAVWSGSERVPALARQAVWRDLGAAGGPLCAGFLFPALSAWLIYASAAALLGSASLGLIRSGIRAR
jgi:MFS family permease